MTGPVTKLCSECGAKFLCGAASTCGQCWCAALPHIMPKNATEDCYCPDCLKRKIAQQLADQAQLPTP